MGREPLGRGKGPKKNIKIFLKKSIDVCWKNLRAEVKERVKYPEEGIRKGGRNVGQKD